MRIPQREHFFKGVCFRAFSASLLLPSWLAGRLANATLASRVRSITPTSSRQSCMRIKLNICRCALCLQDVLTSHIKGWGPPFLKGPCSSIMRPPIILPRIALWQGDQRHEVTPLEPRARWWLFLLYIRTTFSILLFLDSFSFPLKWR